MQVSIDEIAELIGNKEIEIMVLKSQLSEAQKRVEELTSRLQQAATE